MDGRTREGEQSGRNANQTRRLRFWYLPSALLVPSRGAPGSRQRIFVALLSVKPHAFKIGDLVVVTATPADLHDAAGLGTPELFARVVGKTLRVDGFGRYGHLELNVLDDGSQAPDCCHNTIWIEPEFVKGVDEATPII